MIRRFVAVALSTTVVVIAMGLAADPREEHPPSLQSPSTRTATSSKDATARAVLSDQLGFPADISADGRFLVTFTQPYGRGTKEAPSQVEIHDLGARTAIVLQGGTSPAGTPGRPAAVFSPDARRVAYSWLDERLSGTGMLQVIEVASEATPRTLIPADASDIGIVPHGWSPDGRSILVLIHGPSDRLTSDPTSIGWVSVADGTVRTIKTLEPWRGGNDAYPRLSPDGRWIAYSAVAREGATERHIYLMDAEGRSARALAALPGSCTSPVWTADSGNVVFRHVQGEQRGLYAVSVAAGGGPGAAPVRLTPQFDGEPIRITASGALLYRTYGGGTIGLLVERGPEGGRVVQEFSGYGTVWRENRLVFIRGDREVVVRSLDTGSERAYPHTFLPIFAPRVLRDGSAAIVYVFPGADNGRPGGSFYRVDFASGEFKRLFGKDTAHRMRSNVGVVSHDDRTLYLGVFADSPPGWSGVVGVDLATGDEGRFVPLPDPRLAGGGMALSPDGTTLAIQALDGRIVTMRLDGEGFREVHGPSPGGGWRDVMQWSPDGRSIIFATRSAPTSSTWRLVRVAASGGPPEAYGVESSRLPREGQLTSMDLSPDGLHVAIGLRTKATFDVRALDRVMAGREQRR
jgi:hypothetical protein